MNAVKIFLRYKKTRKFWLRSFVLLSIGIGLLIFGGYLFLPTHPQTSMSTIATVQPVAPSDQVHIFTSPDLAVKQFYGDIIANKYNDAFTLLSTNAQQSLESGGGITDLREQVQLFTNKYGIVTNYTVESQRKISPTKVIVTLNLHRTQFSAAQIETDAFTTIFDGKSWTIDNWTSDIANSSQQ